MRREDLLYNRPRQLCTLAYVSSIQLLPSWFSLFWLDLVTFNKTFYIVYTAYATFYTGTNKNIISHARQEQL